MAYNDKGDYDRAIDDYTQAIQLNPNDAYAYKNRGLAYNDKGDFDRTIEDYTQAIQFNPNDAYAYKNRGMVWLHLAAWDKAKSDLTAARDRGMDIIALFHNDYESVPDFERRNGLKLPADIAAMLTPQQ